MFGTKRSWINNILRLRCSRLTGSSARYCGRQVEDGSVCLELKSFAWKSELKSKSELMVVRC